MNNTNTNTATNFNPLGSRMMFDGLEGVWTVTEAVQNRYHDEKFDVRYMSEDRLTFFDCTISVQEIEGHEVLWAVDTFKGHGGGPRVKNVRVRVRMNAEELEAGDRIVKIEDHKDWTTNEVLGKFYYVIDTRTVDELIETFNEMNNPLQIAISEGSYHAFGDWDENEGIGSSDISCVAISAAESLGIFVEGLTDEQWMFIRGQVRC